MRPGQHLQQALGHRAGVRRLTQVGPAAPQTYRRRGVPPGVRRVGRRVGAVWGVVWRAMLGAVLGAENLRSLLRATLAHHITLPQRSMQALANLAQQGIPRCVAQCSVDLLETVNLQKQQRTVATGAVALRADAPTQALPQAGPVGPAGQGVGPGAGLQLLLVVLLRADGDVQTCHAQRLVVRSPLHHRPAGLHPGPVALGVGHPNRAAARHGGVVQLGLRRGLGVAPVLGWMLSRQAGSSGAKVSRCSPAWRNGPRFTAVFPCAHATLGADGRWPMADGRWPQPAAPVAAGCAGPVARPRR